MPAAVASRARELGKKSKANRDAPLPSKKRTKLSHSNGIKALLDGTPNKPAVTANVNGVGNSRTDAVDEATAVVGGVQVADKETIEISSGEEESDSSGSEDGEDSRPGAQELNNAAVAANGHVDEDDDQPMEDGTAEPEELSFGERLQAQEPESEPVRAPHVVDVEAAFAGPNAESRALATASNSRPLSAPSASSLGTVLSQALRTNDQELLESCLRVIDVDTIYATVERLPSPLVGSLLQKLAERLHKKPGRAGMLMVWVQWLVCLNPLSHFRHKLISLSSSLPTAAISLASPRW